MSRKGEVEVDGVRRHGRMWKGERGGDSDTEEKRDGLSDRAKW